MRTTLILLVSLLLLGTVSAQNRSAGSRWSLDVLVGPSFPVGKFAAKTFSSGGLVNQAKPGIGAELALNYRITRAFGVCVAADGQVNPVTNYGDLSARPELYVHHVDAWQIGRLLGGAQFSQPLSAGKRTVLLVRAMAGALKTSIPGYDHTGSTSVPWTFAWQADAGIKWMISGNVYLLFNTGYAGATAEYLVYYQDPGFPVPPTKKAVPTGTFQLHVGAEIGL